jgi:hypothetical protein
MIWHGIYVSEAFQDDIGATQGFQLGRKAGCRQMSKRAWAVSLVDGLYWLRD